MRPWHHNYNKRGAMRERALYGVRRNPEGHVQTNHRFFTWLQDLPSPGIRENFNLFSSPPVLPTRQEVLHEDPPPPFHPVRDSKLVTDAEYHGFMDTAIDLPALQPRHQVAPTFQASQVASSPAPPPSWPARQSVVFPSACENFSGPGPVQSEKHGLDEESTIASPSIKRTRGAMGSIRRRLSVTGTAASQYTVPRSRASPAHNARTMGETGRQVLGRITPSTLLNRNDIVSPMKTAGAATQAALVPHYSLRFAFVGDQQAGKSSLLARFMKGIFMFDYHPTVFAMEATSAHVDNFKATVEIIQDESNLAGVADKWLRHVRGWCENTPIVLVGLKKDLRPFCPTLRLKFLNEPVAATLGQAEVMAHDIGAAKYFECSAKTGEGVHDFFENAIRLAVQAKREREHKMAEIRRKNKSTKLSKLFCFA